jgi:hypothetical protein
MKAASNLEACLGPSLPGPIEQLSWVLKPGRAPPVQKIFAVLFVPTLADNMFLSWEDCVAGTQATMHGWLARKIPHFP